MLTGQDTERTAHTKTSLTRTASCALSYHFVCNYCGMRNDKTARLSGSATEAHSPGDPDAEAALCARLDRQAAQALQGDIAALRQEIAAYGEGLREARGYGYPPFRARKDRPPERIGRLDGVCAHCGKTQAWAARAEDETRRTAALAAGLGLMLCFGGTVIAIVIGDGPLETALGIAGMACLLGGLALTMILGGRMLKRNRVLDAAEPNDPYKLPVIDGGSTELPFS